MPVTAAAPAAMDVLAPRALGVHAIVCDWAGVLTNPIGEILTAYCDAAQVAPERIGSALARAGERYGADPFAELECRRITEVSFLDRIGVELDGDGGVPVDLSDFRRTWFAEIRPNRVFLSYLAGLPSRGISLALVTNNVHEWDALWRSMLPPQALFSVVVTSADEGIRKPDPLIYRRTLERLGHPAEACLFVDDSAENCEGARACGIDAIQFTCTSQAIDAIEERLSR